jgi:aldehyde dehydrogenase (NAD+)
MRDAAENLVFAGLELGGKSPSIVFPDADMDRAVEDTLKTYFNAGQICFATTRVFVHEDVYDEFTARLVEGCEAMELGGPLEDPDMGPVISADALDDVERYVREAEADGATVRAGGYAPEREGHFYAPTLIEGAADDAPISCDEVFGPVVTLYSFASEAEAIRRANDTDYGLYGLVWTTDLGRAHRVSAAIEAGTVQVNEYSVYYPQLPSGGYKESGIGRVRGLQAVDRYTQLKNVTVTLNGEASPGRGPGAGPDA